MVELGIAALQLASNEREESPCACMRASLVTEKGEVEGRSVQPDEIKWECG